MYSAAINMRTGRGPHGEQRRESSAETGRAWITAPAKFMISGAHCIGKSSEMPATSRGKMYRQPA